MSNTQEESSVVDVAFRVDAENGVNALDAEVYGLREIQHAEAVWRTRPYYVRPSKSWPERWVVSAPGLHAIMSGPRAEARAREYAAWASVSAPVDLQSFPCGSVTITGPRAMTPTEMWDEIKSVPALRVCLEAEIQAARENAPPAR
jgi:hypothetical protein